MQQRVTPGKTPTWLLALAWTLILYLILGLLLAAFYAAGQPVSIQASPYILAGTFLLVWYVIYRFHCFLEGGEEV